MYTLGVNYEAKLKFFLHRRCILSLSPTATDISRLQRVCTVLWPLVSLHVGPRLPKGIIISSPLASSMSRCNPCTILERARYFIRVSKLPTKLTYPARTLSPPKAPASIPPRTPPTPNRPPQSKPHTYSPTHRSSSQKPQTPTNSN